MSCSVSHYWDEHLERLDDRFGYSVHIEERPNSEAMVLESEDRREGVIDARIWFGEDAYLDVYERVKITDRPHRLHYNYQLMVDGEEAVRYDYDPELPEPYKHHINRPLGDGLYTHEPTGRISLTVLLKGCWLAIEAFRQQRADEEMERPGL